MFGVLLGEGLVEEPDHDGEVAPFVVAVQMLLESSGSSRRMASTHVGSRTEYLFFCVDMVVAMMRCLTVESVGSWCGERSDGSWRGQWQLVMEQGLA